MVLIQGSVKIVVTSKVGRALSADGDLTEAKIVPKVLAGHPQFSSIAFHPFKFMTS